MKKQFLFAVAALFSATTLAQVQSDFRTAFLIQVIRPLSPMVHLPL